jgi:HAMP domain-containing protein
MSKKPKSFTVDEDIAEELSERDNLNASAVVNNYLREFLDATDRTESEVIISEINRQISEVEDEIETLEKKRDRLVDRKERIKSRDEERKQSERDDIISSGSDIPASPEHPWVIDHAAEINMTPIELAQAIADEHNKEFDPFNETDNDLQSL